MWRVVAGSVLLHAGAMLFLRALPTPRPPELTRGVPIEIRVESREIRERAALPPPLDATPPARRVIVKPARPSAVAASKPAAPAPAWLPMRASPVLPRAEAVAAAGRDGTVAEAPARPAPAASSPDIGGHIADDGSVTFPASPSRPTVELPCPSCAARELDHDVTEWAKDPYAYARTYAGGTHGTLGKPSFAILPASGPVIYVPLLRGHGDLDGGAPPDRGRQSAFLDATRDERALLAGRARARGSADALHGLPRRLGEIWSDSRLTPAARRRLLFTLWDECADDEDGVAARAAILDFVRARLPRGGPDGYTDAELDELNRRRAAAAQFRP